MKTEYKGFNIVPSQLGVYGTLFFIQDLNDGLVVEWSKQDGYGSMNNAKGAITKHLKAIVIPFDFTATEQRIAELVEQVRDSGMTILVPTKPVVQSRNKREGRYAGKSQKVIITRNGKKVDIMLPVHVRATDICLAHASKRDL